MKINSNIFQPFGVNFKSLKAGTVVIDEEGDVLLVAVDGEKFLVSLKDGTTFGKTATDYQVRPVPDAEVCIPERTAKTPAE